MPKSAVPVTEPERNVELAKAIAADGRFTYEIAGLAQVHPTYLGKVIKGTQRPSAAVRARLANALGVPEHELFEDA